MVDSHGKNASNEPEVLQVVLIAKPGLWVDLEGVIITGERKGGRVGVGDGRELL